MRASRWGVVAAVAAVTACGGSPGPSLATYASSGPGDLAAISGVLTVDGDCVYVTITDGRRVLLAFPRGRATWDNGRLIFAGSSYGRDTAIELSGSMVGAPVKLAQLSAPASCDRTLLWAVTEPT